MLRLVFALSAAALLGACAAPQPVLYQEGAAAGERKRQQAGDLAFCRQQAQKNIGTGGRPLAHEAGRAGAIGFVGAAVGSLVNGSSEVLNRAAGAAAGGAAGVATKLLIDWNAPDEVHRKYVERCMKRRGHEVLGWR